MWHTRIANELNNNNVLVNNDYSNIFIPKNCIGRFEIMLVRFIFIGIWLQTNNTVGKKKSTIDKRQFKSII